MQVCAEPGCPELVEGGRCPQHQRAPRPGRPMPTDWPATRARIIRRDGAVCQLKLQGCVGKATSVDHVIPTSRGGSDDDSNLVACCWPCNRRKGNRPR